MVSRGKSGTNLEYALRLAECQRRMAPHIRDEHLFSIERQLLAECARIEIQDELLRRLLAAASISSIPQSRRSSIRSRRGGRFNDDHDDGVDEATKNALTTTRLATFKARAPPPLTHKRSAQATK